MRGEIDNQHAPARRHEPRRLAQGAGRIVEVMQHLVDHHQIEGVRLHRRRMKCRPGAARFGRLRPSPDWPGPPRAWHGWHRARPRGRRAAPEGPACAPSRYRDQSGCGSVHHRVRRVPPPRHSCSCGMQRAQFVPFRRNAREIGLPRPPPADDAWPAAAPCRHRHADPRRRARQAADAADASPWRDRRAGRKPTPPRDDARPAPDSTSSLRWREMRGCDWPRMSVRSETDNSPSARRARMRRTRLLSPPHAMRRAPRSSRD